MKIYVKSPFWRRVARRIGRGLFSFAENNDDSRLASNGEIWLLSNLIRLHAKEGKSRPYVVFDGGGNTGDYTNAVLQQGLRLEVKVDISIFEPSPYCVDSLRRRFSHYPEVKVVAAGLADEKREAKLLFDEPGSTLASFVPRTTINPNGDRGVTVPLIRLDEYMKEKQVSRIDLLKLDVEGYELKALRGLHERLAPEVVDIVQFEYGGATLDAGDSLRELYKMFESRGYAVGKVFPKGLELRPYYDWMEHYSYANYVALSPRFLTL